MFLRRLPVTIAVAYLVTAIATCSSQPYYMGRPIAGFLSWHAAHWLSRATRADEEQPEAVLDALQIPRGAVVADVGAGAGYYSLRLARRVGPEGLVYATDTQREMLEFVRLKASEAGITNIRTVSSGRTDTGLPAASVDLILMVDVYHECADPGAVLDGLHAALKPGGRLVLLEFRGEDPAVPVPPEHRMTLKQVRREIEPRGFAFVASLEFLPWQHIIVFERAVGAG